MVESADSEDSAYATPNLFGRVRGDLLRPLTGPNRSRMWALLVDLYTEYFGPDAAIQPEDGYPHRTITLAIEKHVLTHAAWEPEEGIGELSTPPNVRANNLLERLTESGWLRETRRGVRNFLSMGEYEAHFLEMLKRFAEDGPPRIGCDVQTILISMRALSRDPRENAAGLPTAAKLARDMVATLTNTRVRARELVERLGSSATTAEYVEGFFTQYITTLFIGDYRELRMKNHPLQHRHEILEILSDLRDDPDKRAALLEGYKDLMPSRAPHEADSALRRDLERLRRFEDVEDHLDRLDSGMGKASRQAISFIAYRLRSRGAIEKSLKNAAEAIVGRAGEDEPMVLVPWAPGALFKNTDLREPIVPRPPRVRVPIVRHEPSIDELALWQLQREMTSRRVVKPEDVRTYVVEQLGDRRSVESDELSIDGVRDMVIFEALSRIAMMRTRKPQGGADMPMSAATRWMKVELIDGQRTDLEELNSPAFRITLEKGS